MKKVTYDFAFPLGAACAASLAMRVARLQYASFPLDWVGGGTITGRAQLVADDFKDWLRAEDLELTDVLFSTFNASIYRNRRTGLSFTHDFPAGCYLEDELPSIAEKYDRRIKRLYAEIGKAKRILVVYNEIPYRPVADEVDVLKAQKILQTRFPHSRIDLLYFAQDSECKDLKTRALNENVTMILLDYHSIAMGYVDVAARYAKMFEYLKERYEVPDKRTQDQVTSIFASAEERSRQRWGTGLRKWINMRAFHMYRHLERFLIKRGCIPNTERPLKLYQERGERRPSLMESDISSMPRDEVAVRQAYALL